jgi:hypothetical protein
MLPVKQLVNESGTQTLRRGRYLNREKLADRLRFGGVRFVVADIGKPLTWLSSSETYCFWKAEVKNRLPDSPEQFRLEDFAGDYCFLASEWIGSSEAVILPERYH